MERIFVILLDTHVIIWDALAPERLSKHAQQAILQANESGGILVCDISLWEIAMLIKKGRVQVDVDCQSFINLVIEANRIVVQQITPQIATLAVELPDVINQDPADRLIAATALAEDSPLLTADRNLLAAAQIPTIW
ncbi:MAG: type II toxin-antitoxin system VapC family toxin [Chloroflexota bacterium]|nr:type II toxin-antitoxin system VapC family toxin [Chloroflexota bacterium]